MSYAPNYKIKGSILAEVADAKHDFKGKEFLVDNTKKIDLDTDEIMNLRAGTDMTVHADATMSVDADTLLKIGSAVDGDFKNVSDANDNSNVRLMTGSVDTDWQPSGQSLYYADSSGNLKMLAQPTNTDTSTDASTQILACVQSSGNLEWKDAEAASLHCLGLTTYYKEDTSGVEFKISSTDVSTGAGVPPLLALEAAHGHPTTFGPLSNNSSVPGYGDCRLKNGTDEYFYFKAHQSGDYNVFAQVEIVNEEVDGSYSTIDVSGQRTLELIKMTTVSQSTVAVLTNAVSLYTITKQPNPDSDIPTDMVIATSVTLGQHDVISVRAKTTSGTVRARLRKFDVHYVCEN